MIASFLFWIIKDCLFLLGYISGRQTFHKPLTPDEEQRLEIIRTTYRHAVEAGDKNVYLIEGKELMALAGNDGTVDNCHPNDLGFASMAKAVGDLLETLL